MADKVRRQHYVWRKYLQPWTSDHKIWCRRDSKTFHTELMNVAQQRDFYVPQPLNDLEKAFLRAEARQSRRGDVVELVENEIALRDEMFAALHAARSAGDAAAAEELETMIHNAEEMYQGQIEQAGLPNLIELVDGRIEWARDDARWQSFILYFSTQYLRTKRIQEMIARHLAGHSARLGYSVERLQSISRSIDVLRLCEGIYDSTSPVLLRAPDGCEFITCDQPAFNVNAAFHPLTFQQFPHEFYYPVSPKFAVLMVDGSRSAASSRDAAPDEVDRYNAAMQSASLEQVFGRTCEAVEQNNTARAAEAE